MGKRKNNKSIENINCPKCKHHKVWVLHGEYKRCTKCGNKFVPEQEQNKNLLGFLKK